MAQTDQVQNIKSSMLALKLFMLIPQFPRIISNIKKAKRIKENSNESIGMVIESKAIKHGDVVALKYEDQSFTYREFNQVTNRYANYLLSEGVNKDKTVIAFIENRPELLFLIAACAKIGAIVSLVNPNQREKTLIHSLRLTKSKFFFIGEELLPFFENVRSSLTDTKEDKYYWISDRQIGNCPTKFNNVKKELEKVDSNNPTTTQGIMANQVYAYVFTSGTTGLPKASRQTNRKWLTTYYWFGKVNMNLNTKDVMYVPLPFYHTNALIVGWPTALAGSCTMVMRRKFSVSEFWQDVDKYKVSAFIYIGELCRYLLNAPPSDFDKKHRIKKIMGNGLRPDIWHEFKERFRIKNIFEFYGAADGNVGFTNTFNFNCTLGWSPQNYKIIKYDIKNETPIKDSDGFLVPVRKGETGLLISEISKESIFDGYVNKQQNEDKIIRNAFKVGDIWFNSGDLLQDLGLKHARFIDRIGDTFRWKGENVATAEIEGIVNQLNCVEMCAVYGVQIPNNDGRAGMVTIVKKRKVDFDIDAIANQLLKNLPKYAVPIFIRLKDKIDFTHTHKIKKFDLKKDGFICNDKVFVMLPKSKNYIQISKNLLNEINAGDHIF